MSRGDEYGPSVEGPDDPAERPDRGSRALADAMHREMTGEPLVDCELCSPRAERILANGAVFLPDGAELERLRRIEEAARRIADDHKEGWPSIGAMGQLFRALDPAEPEGSAQG